MQLLMCGFNEEVWEKTTESQGDGIMQEYVELVQGHVKCGRSWR